MNASEADFRDAAEEGSAAVYLLCAYALSGDPVDLARAITQVEIAAFYYHEGQRENGECPMCGSIFSDPLYGRRFYNSSVGCCLEPPEADGEDFRGSEASAYAAEQQHAAQRLK